MVAAKFSFPKDYTVCVTVFTDITHYNTVNCLLFLLLHRKAAFKAQHNKIHLNLSIALLLGLIVFISGIETAKDDKVNISFYCL